MRYNSLVDFLFDNVDFAVITYIFTALKRSLRRLCIHRYLSVHGGWVSATHTLPLGRHPPRQTHPSPDTPWADTSPPNAFWDTHSPAQCMLGYSQQAGSTHPTGMHSCSDLSFNGYVTSNCTDILFFIYSE